MKKRKRKKKTEKNGKKSVIDFNVDHWPTLKPKFLVANLHGTTLWINGTGASENGLQI